MKLTLLASAVALADRRQFLLRRYPTCSRCASPQTYLLTFDDHSAEWKCRMCHYVFAYDPAQGYGA